MHVSMAPIPISGTEIRARIARAEDVSAMVPGPVLEYIRRHHLYGHP
jgi:nicotinate-nucleotide adenylyltransferase